MDILPPTDDTGVFDSRYLAFLQTVTSLRPKLHRYCARMTGSVLDGEDVVQEALFQAYRKLDTFDDTRPLTPWLFRIAHNHCIDFFRRRGARIEAETAAALEAEPVVPATPPALPGPEIGRAVEHLVLTLPPKERACVLLKDVFDYSLEEIAELVESTVGGVKAALSRGRAKLAAAAPAPAFVTPQPDANAEMRRLLHLYVQRFNARDWDGVRSLIAADARVRVADRVNLRNCAEFMQAPIELLEDSPYFGRYARMAPTWRLAVADVDGEPVIVRLQQDGARGTPFALIRLSIADDCVREIADYSHCPWVIEAARVLTFDEAMN